MQQYRSLVAISQLKRLENGLEENSVLFESTIYDGAWKLERDAVESSSEAECFSSATFFKEFAFAAATLNPNKCL
jgi:hypothetical protein